MDGYSAIAIPIKNDGDSWVVIGEARSDESFDPENDQTFIDLNSGRKGRTAAPSSGPVPPVTIGENGVIRLVETIPYDWKVTGSDTAEVRSQLKGHGRGPGWSHRKGETHGRFQVINYLGIATFEVKADRGSVVIDLELVSKKLDYDTEFRQLTTEIAEFCQQLLLTWESPTSLRFETDVDRQARLLLEQFLFLRGCLDNEKLEGILGSILQRPHTALKSEKEWTPVTLAGSNDWLKNPAGMARDWLRDGNGGHLPAEVLHVRRYDSHDTPPNRFLKFALESFLELCLKVIATHPEAVTLAADAGSMSRQLEEILGRSFFRELSPLSRLPLDNQTLQKKHGYRDVLQTWILVEAALSLTWDGNNDAASGPSRDVATLYEYWIFLKLHSLLDSLKGVTRSGGLPSPEEDPEAFLQSRGEELIINLKRSKRSCARFNYRDETGDRIALNLNLYYERVFAVTDSAASADSYSRRFKPDYTLAVFPASFKNEAAASQEGQIAFVHFDAKYRAQSISDLFGDIGEPDEVIDEEKISGKTVSTYRRGDLLKMHTYNDAVRQTIGSYVLYPGSDTNRGDMGKFHELVPGVGAFVLKPGNDECLKSLGSFLRDILEHQSDRFTQLSRIRYWTHNTVKDEPAAYITRPKELSNDARPLEDRPAALFYMRSQEMAEWCRAGRAVYCHASRKDGTPQKQRPEIFSAEWVVPHFGGKSAGWIAKVKSYRLMDRIKLAGLLAIDESRLSVSHYHVFVLEAPVDTFEISIKNDFKREELNKKPLPIPLGKVFR